MLMLGNLFEQIEARALFTAFGFRFLVFLTALRLTFPSNAAPIGSNTNQAFFFELQVFLLAQN